MPTGLSQMRWTQFALTPLQMPSVSCSHHRSSNYFLKCSVQPIAVFWDSYIDLVCLLLRFTRVTREGIWSLPMCEMLPWVFAYDRTNYARYLSIYWCKITLLPRTHIHANAMLESGQFAVQHSSNSARGPDGQVSTTLKASSTRMAVCHTRRMMQMMSTKSCTPSRAG